MLGGLTGGGKVLLLDLMSMEAVIFRFTSLVVELSLCEVAMHQLINKKSLFISYFLFYFSFLDFWDYYFLLDNQT